MIWLIIGVGIYLAIGVFILVIFWKNELTGFTLWNVPAVLFGWLPIGLFFWVKDKIENL